MATVIPFVPQNITVHLGPPGEAAKNVLFDIVVPPRYKYSDEELIGIIKARVNEAGNGNLYAVILVDRSYGVLKSEDE